MKLSNIFKFIKKNQLKNQKRCLSVKLKIDEGYMNEAGIMLVEVILIAVFLASLAVATPYFFAQNQAVMRSSSQTIECQTIAQQALTNTVSLGARLYGYKINTDINKRNDEHLGYNPLFIKKKNGTDIDDVGDGSELSFPPKKYKMLYKNLGISPTIQDPKKNTGKVLIGSTHPYDLSTSTLLVNSVNALQYLYNSDNEFFTDNDDMGKKYTLEGVSKMVDGSEMASLWEQYKDRFDLEDINFYIKVAPIYLTTNEEMPSPPRNNCSLPLDGTCTPSQILTRPRFHNEGFTITPDLNILGHDNIGFEITVMLKYTRDDQEYTCNAKQRFSHQGKIVTKQKTAQEEWLTINFLTGLKTGANIDLKNNSDLNTTPITPAIPSDLLMTSCDTHGAGYDDITATVDFSSIGEGQQAGTVLLCRMSSFCRSYGYSTSYGACTSELGKWRRCHNITPDGTQSWTFSSKFTSSTGQELEMKFSGMQTDRRYELDVGEFAIDGYNLRYKTVAKFYLDAKRPEITHRRITNNIVGRPGDHEEGRNYKHPHPPTDWRTPPNSSTRWLQCRTGTVEFAANQTDQFTHNLHKCNITGNKEDGNGTSSVPPTTQDPTPQGHLKQTSDCAGELNVNDHGRYTVTFAGGDTCGTHASSTKDLVWDYDDPGTFAPQSFLTDPEWFYSSDKDAYPIETEVPGIGAGKFPKHYSVDCDDNYKGTVRKDGNSGKLECELSGSVPAHDDGCNLRNMGVRYYHICGGGQTGCEHTKKKKWGVYAPHGESCVNVQCEPGLSCCDASSGSCDAGVSDKQCGTPDTRDCTNPKGGIQSQSDEVPSGCPPLGLVTCDYELPCEGTFPYSRTGPNPDVDCAGKRQTNSCSFSDSGTCTPNAGVGTHENRPSDVGTCRFPGTSWTKTCTATVTEFCDIWRNEIRTRDVCVGGNVEYDCNCTTTCNNGICTQTCQTCQRYDSCATTRTETYQVRVCDDYDYRASTNTCYQTVLGSCGSPSGGCSRKGRGGGILSQERCEIRSPICCDSNSECCPGDTHSSNPTHCPSPPSSCNSNIQCCTGNGDSCATNPLCCTEICDSTQGCCRQNGDDHTNNPTHCPSPPICDPNKRCCDGDTPQTNSKCGGKKVDGECSPNGCSAGKQETHGNSWICEGEGGGRDDVCDPPCTDRCCPGDSGYPNCEPDPEIEPPRPECEDSCERGVACGGGGHSCCRVGTFGGNIWTEAGVGSTCQWKCHNGGYTRECNKVVCRRTSYGTWNCNRGDTEGTIPGGG